MAEPTPGDLQYMQAHVDDSRQPNLIATLVLCILFAYVSVILRFVARHKIRASTGVDDVWIVIALV